MDFCLSCTYGANITLIFFQNFWRSSSSNFKINLKDQLNLKFFEMLGADFCRRSSFVDKYLKSLNAPQLSCLKNCCKLSKLHINCVFRVLQSATIIDFRKYISSNFGILTTAKHLEMRMSHQICWSPWLSIEVVGFLLSVHWLFDLK